MILERSDSNLQEAYDKGYQCFFDNGVTGQTLCPYALGTEIYNRWMAGFMDAKTGK